MFSVPLFTVTCPQRLVKATVLIVTPDGDAVWFDRDGTRPDEGRAVEQVELGVVRAIGQGGRPCHVGRHGPYGTDHRPHAPLRQLPGLANRYLVEKPPVA